MIKILDLNDVWELTKTKALIWKKIIDAGWSESDSFQKLHNYQEYEASHENFRLHLRVNIIGKKRSKKLPELMIFTEDLSLKIVYTNCRRLLKITDLIIKTR